ncbi:MAG TPA: hypothetical protein VJ861_09050 [Treponemataceae bacterium]|nr:hypothetical protein [Treponemataceae bacterium]
MQNLLGRIERQYILDTLSQTLVPFSISIGTDYYSVEQGSYSLLGSLIELHKPFPEVFIQKNCNVRFYHKDRLLTFNSVPQSCSNELVSLKIPLAIFKENEIQSISEVYVDLHCNNGILHFITNEKLSVLNIVPNPLIFEEKKRSIELLALKIGFTSFTNCISYRLYEALEWFSHNQPNRIQIKDGILLFIDHESLLVLTEAHLIKREDKEILNKIFLRYDKRIIKADGCFAGELRLNSKYCIRHFVFSIIQEEDRRFLFESCYNHRYI